jgi:hypothetical protein
MQIKVLGRRRRWTFPCGVMDLFVISRRRSRPFPVCVLELWKLSRRRRRPKLWALRVSVVYTHCCPGALSLESLEQEKKAA